MSYTVYAEWDDAGWWVVTAPDVPGAITQCRRLDQVPADAAEVIEIQTGESVDVEALNVVPVLAGDAGRAADEAREDRRAAEAVRARSERSTREAAALLRDRGFPLRDIGKLLGVSFQRAGQLVAARNAESA